jgi:hypothetical protein
VIDDRDDDRDIDRGDDLDDERDDDELKPPAITLACEPLLVSAGGAARICGLSVGGWRKLDRQGLVPRALAIGRRRVWSVTTLRRWCDAGCPSRAEFERALDPQERSLTPRGGRALIAKR